AGRKLVNVNAEIVAADQRLDIGQRLGQAGVVDAAFGNFAVDRELNSRVWRALGVKSEESAAANAGERGHSLGQLAGKSGSESRAELESLDGAADVPATGDWVDRSLDFDALDVVAGERPPHL